MGRILRHTLRLATLVACLAAAVPALASAAPGWTPPAAFPAPSGGTTSYTQVGFGPDGVATVAYLQIVSLATPVQTVLHIGTISPGGLYVEQTSIASTTTSVPDELTMSEAPDGAAVVEYEVAASDNLSAIATAPTTFDAIYRSAGATTWGSPTSVASDNPESTTFTPTMVTTIATDGTAAAGVQHVDPTLPASGGERIDVAVAKNTGVWGSPAEISLTGDDNLSLDLAFDANDNLTAAFTSAAPQSNSSNDRPEAEIATRSGTAQVWGAPSSITGSSPTVYTTSPVRLGVAADGSAVAAVQLSSGSTIDTWATTRSGASGSWSTLANLTSGASSSAPFIAAVSPTDKAYVVYDYQGSDSGLDCLGVVRAPISGAFTPSACASPTDYQSLSQPQGIVFLNNDAYFSFIGQPNGGTATDLEAVIWPDAASQPGAPTTLVSPQTPAPGLVAMLSDNDGGVPIIFNPGTGNGSGFDVSAWDAGGPLLTSASVPTSAVAGQPTAFSAAFTDLWSDPVSAPSWNFGDGGTASGASVTHTFSSAGTYVVTAGSADSLGNPTSTTATVTVAAAPPVTSTTPTSTTPTSTTPTPAPLKLTGLTQTHASWLEHKRKHPKGKQPAVGSSFHYTLSAAASVTVTFSTSTTGRRVKGKCVATTSKNKTAKHCTLVVSKSETVAGHLGANTLAFTGAVKGHGVLAPGRYTVTFKARSGTLASATATLRFTILAP